ncbi:hypothetical protein [Spirochaeta cellobiosiphila]|uniref:hypothetical protein n=1 Tax=Spirochaeta cellobiosiphila TaxID=504483 RepID=UPI0004125339|nr:hypothetical protein [Spirochaeta cellobiosiphila]
MVAKNVLLCTSLLVFNTFIYADVNPFIDLSYYNVLRGEEQNNPFYISLAIADLSFKSSTNPYMKSEVLIHGELQNDAQQLELKKAYSKIKLPTGRLTLGKTRTTWGIGQYYNAGDVIFGNDEADLTQEELKKQTRWLNSYYLPLGSFSFIEALIIAPEETTDSIDKTRAGGRLQMGFSFITFETAYMYDGNDSNVTFNFQSAIKNLEVYGASHWTYTSNNNSAISIGLQSQWSLWEIHALSLRSECILFPENFDLSRFYGDILYSNGGLNIYWRNVYIYKKSDIKSILGGSWNIFQNVYLLEYNQCQFVGNEIGSWSVSVGVKVIY